MTTIINSPPASPAPSDGGGGMGVLVGIVLAVVVVAFLFMLYGLPALRSTQNTDGGKENSTTINVPDKIDVSVPEKINVDVEK